MKKTMVIMISFLLGITLASNIHAMEFDELGGVDIHGFISQGFLQSDENNFFADTENGTTQYDDMGINFSSDVSDKLRMGIQFYARDLGTVGNNDVSVDWAMADYRYKDWLGIRAGKLKLESGLYNTTRDLDMLRTSVLLPQSVYNESWRETTASIQGAGLYGEIPMRKAGNLSYGLQYGTMLMPSQSGAARLIEDQWPLNNLHVGPYTYKDATSIDAIDVDVKNSYSGILQWQTPLDGLTLGGTTWGYKFESLCRTTLKKSYYEGMKTIYLAGGGSPTDSVSADLDSVIAIAADKNFPTFDSTFTADAKAVVLSMEYTWKNLVFASEYMAIRYNLAFNSDLFNASNSPLLAAALATKTTVNMNGSNMEVPVFTSEGWYAMASYRFAYWFELGMFYSEYYPNKDDKDGTLRVAKGLDDDPWRAWLKDSCMTLRFDVTENWVLKLEGHVFRGAATILGADNPMPTDGSHRYDDKWMMGAAKITYSF